MRWPWQQSAVLSATFVFVVYIIVGFLLDTSTGGVKVKLLIFFYFNFIIMNMNMIWPSKFSILGGLWLSQSGNIEHNKHLSPQQ